MVKEHFDCSNADTIAAIATPPGRGGVGIIRISGPLTRHIVNTLLGKIPKPRTATYATFKDQIGNTLDQGLCLYFKQPYSFTGEDVAELQAHGGPVVLDQLLHCVLALGARVAQPGEFTQRAFLNGKIDLMQAEAVADLIDASSQQAARCAVRSLQGEFSKQVNHISDKLITLRMFIEAAIDFPEEEVDFIAESRAQQDLAELIDDVSRLLNNAQQGVVLKEGMTIVLLGKPNVGKSSLLNCLSGRDSAIVTAVAGTTRDALREHIQINGLPIQIIDTAGIHATQDIVEQEGMRRTHHMVQQADLVLVIVDAGEVAHHTPQISQLPALIQVSADYLELLQAIPPGVPHITLCNKIDLLGQEPEHITTNTGDIITLSARYQRGIELLMHYLQQKAGYQPNQEGIFLARRRHLHALSQVYQHLITGLEQLQQRSAYELVAEELAHAQQPLGELTGEFSADDLLGKIFSTFCIGK